MQIFDMERLMANWLRKLLEVLLLSQVLEMMVGTSWELIFVTDHAFELI